MKFRLFLTALLAAICQSASAGPLTVDLGGFLCADNQACDSNPATNVMTVTAGLDGVPSVPGYNIAIATSFSNNPGSPNFNILDLTWTVASLGTAGGPLTVAVSQTGFANGPLGASQLTSTCSGDVLGIGTVTCQQWVNLSNTLFGLGSITPGAQGPFSDVGFTDTARTLYNGSVPYSITDRLIFNLAATNTSTGDLVSTTTKVPEPATLLLLGGALVVGGIMRRKKV
jgi:hypothetical protein